MSQADEDDEAQFEAILDAVRRADRAAALRLAKQAAEQGLDHPLVLVLAAEGAEETGDLRRAATWLAQATVDAPEDGETWRRYATVLARLEQYEPALAAFKRALEILPGAYPTLIAAGATAFEAGALTESEAYYRQASTLQGDQAQPWAVLSAIAARREDSRQARDLAHKALTLEPNSVIAHMSLARADLIEGAVEDAIGGTSRLLEDPELSSQTRIGALDLRADAYDAAGLTSEAFTDYVTRNAITDRIFGPRIARDLVERRIDQARRLRRYVEQTEPAAWRTTCAPDPNAEPRVSGHVFLLGFPRSGTTLLEKALAGHPAIASMEEVNHLEHCAGLFFKDDASLNRLRDLTAHDASAFRSVYWRGVRNSFEKDISGKVLLDKLPLHSLLLPAIAKLFPEAKVLFALRDPRDVVFSCFRRRFQVNSAMFEFLTLERAAAYYDAVMTLARDYRKTLDLNLLEVRHESAVADFQGELGKILAFIGLNWDAAVIDFAGRARREATD